MASSHSIPTESPSALVYIKVSVTNPITHASEDLTWGTGFLIDLDGHILTAKHVIEWKQDERPGPRTYTVALGFSQGNQITAEVVRSAPGNIDICLIKIPKAAVTAAGVQNAYKPSCRIPKVDEAIIARGFSFASPDEPIQVPGVISAPMNFENKYPSDVPIVPGMSGGPVLDSNGKVIGLNAGGAPNFPTLTFLQPLFSGSEVVQASGTPCPVDSSTAEPDRSAPTVSSQPLTTELRGTLALPREIRRLAYGRLIAQDAVLRLSPEMGAESGRGGAMGAAGVSGAREGASGGAGARGSDGENGSPGQASQSLFLSASELSGKLLIDARGQAGGSGGAGGLGGAGGAGARGKASISGAFDCKSGPGRGGNGGGGGDGGHGGDAAPGGAGGDVEVRIDRLSPGTEIEIVTTGGAAGRQGSGGTPGAGGLAGEEGVASGWCRPAGRAGMPGQSGIPGRDGSGTSNGRPGKISLIIGSREILSTGHVVHKEPFQ